MASSRSSKTSPLPRRSPAASALADARFAPRKVKPKKGRGAYTRKGRADHKQEATR